MKKETELKYFELLKKKVISHFREDFSYVPEDPSKWKITHINYFQEHLFNKNKGNFSDRWFYTYFKNKPEKLARIDMLNILATYAGYKSWGDFISNNPLYKDASVSEAKEDEESVAIINQGPKHSAETQKRNNFFKLWAPMMLVLMAVILFSYNYVDKKRHTYRFHFMDSDRGKKKGVRVYIPSNTSDPVMISDSLGSIEFLSREDSIKMYIQSPFYRKDTFKINLAKSDGEETIELTPNEYALMVYYYSRSENTKVERRRNELNRLIADNALIYQVYDNENYGLEVLSKDQYISLITTPTSSLKNFELISSSEKAGKITHIKFKILPNEKVQ